MIETVVVLCLMLLLIGIAIIAAVSIVELSELQNVLMVIALLMVFAGSFTIGRMAPFENDEVVVEELKLKEQSDEV